MAKLKYDRPLHIIVSLNQLITVPKDEVWKVTINATEKIVGYYANLYGGGTQSTQETSMPPLQASPSNTSKSKQLHGGGAPWLRNLFLTDHFGSPQDPIRKLPYRKTRSGNWVLRASERLMSQALPVPQIVSSEAAQKSLPQLSLAFPASPLRSWRNNTVEGVTLYA